jgi:general stress protein 26
MAKEQRDEREGERLSEEKKLEQLYELIDGIETAMLTTRRQDGSLVSRPMQTQARRAGTDLWFMTSVETDKVREIGESEQVNLAYYKDGTREFVSVSGRARVNRARALIIELYAPDWKAWLGAEGGERDGGPDDPRIALVEVTADSATYLKSTHSRPVALFQVAKAIVTGTQPKAGDLGHLERGTLAQGSARKE